MNNRYHRPVRRHDRVSESYTSTSMLGTSMLMPRTPRHDRTLADCLMRMPIGRIT